MEFTLTTPTLLFSAISLLLLAYTNRYLTLAALIRELYQKQQENEEEYITGQIDNLRTRIYLIRKMQLYGVISFFLCVATTLLLFLKMVIPGEFTFFLSLISLLISLGLSIREIRISVKALDLMLDHCE